MTHYIHVEEGDCLESLSPDYFQNVTWTPWLHCRSVSETAALAARKHIRERGGVLPGEVFTLRVFAKASYNIVHQTVFRVVGGRGFPGVIIPQSASV